MPHDREIPGSPQDWLARAHSDLVLASIPLPDGARLEDLCYHAQQAAEKAVKAVYRSLNLRFRFTHDLADLLEGLLGHGVDVPDEVKACIDLTEYAWQARYPSTVEPVTVAEHADAVALATRTVHWATGLVER